MNATTNADLLLNFIIEVLDDQNGINERAYNALCIFRGIDARIDKVLDAIDSTENRYFLPENDDCLELRA